MKITPHIPYKCECGCVMIAADMPYSHLIYCVNSGCQHHGVFVEIPRVEAEKGKAFPRK